MRWSGERYESFCGWVSEKEIAKDKVTSAA